MISTKIWCARYYFSYSLTVAASLAAVAMRWWDGYGGGTGCCGDDVDISILRAYPVTGLFKMYQLILIISIYVPIKILH